MRAALAEDDSCLNSWREWNQSFDGNGSLDSSRIDKGSVRLLPLVYGNLQAHGVEESILERLKEAYLETWCNNELLLCDATDILRSVQAAGIETILLKGVALALHFYKDPGLRPMSDVDILVHPQDAVLAMSVLQEAGWKSVYKNPEILLTYQHAIDFSDANGHRLDLHWRLLWDGPHDITDDDFWENAIPIEIGDVKTSILNPADQLLHVCVHGAAWNDSPPLRWIVGALSCLVAFFAVSSFFRGEIYKLISLPFAFLIFIVVSILLAGGPGKWMDL